MPSSPDVPLPQLVLVPGLGADPALYAPLKVALGDRVVLPAWIPPESPRERVDHYSRRVAEILRARPDLAEPFVVGGISIGGLVAAHIAEHLGPRRVPGVMLIGACTRTSQISPLFRLTAAVLGRAPRGLSKAMLNRIVPKLFQWHQGLDPEAAGIIDAVAFRTDVPHTQWAAGVITSSPPPAEPPCRVWTIHGGSDRVIPLGRRRLLPGDMVIPDGRHTIHLTHTREVTKFLLDRLDGRVAESGAAARGRVGVERGP